MNPVWPILSGSLQTCHRLVLPSLAFESDEYHLSSINISNLRSLVVRPFWSYDGINARSKQRLTRFLLSHGAIEELDIHDSIEPDTSLFTPDSLPHLSSFDGSASTIGNMASIRMNCLSRTLRQLTVCSLNDHTLKQMFAQFQSADGLGHSNTNHARHSRLLAGLRDIRFSTSLTQKVDTTAIIHDCGTLCGDSLHTWRGDLGLILVESISAREFAALFQPYNQLRTIELRIRNEPGDYPHQEFNWMASGKAFAIVLELAKHCTTLRRVRIHNSSIGPDHIWDIVRTPKPRFGAGGDSCPGPICTQHYVYVPNLSGE